MRLDELDTFEIRIRERREHAKTRTGAVVEALEADTDVLADLVGRCRTLILANNELHALVDDLRRAMAARPTVTVEAPRKTRTRQPPAGQQSEPTPTSDEVGATLGPAEASGQPPTPAVGRDPKDHGTSPQGVVKRWTCADCNSTRVTLDGQPPTASCFCGSTVWAGIWPTSPQDAPGAPGTTDDPSETS